MKLQIFTVYDSKVEAYMQPFFARSIGEALRNWETACNDGESMMAKHPSDYSLFQIGEFDDTNGSINILEAKKALGTAVEAKRAIPKQDDIESAISRIKQKAN